MTAAQHPSIGPRDGAALVWRSAGLSDVGASRSVNEDALLDKPEGRVWAVADGMGGHAAGDVASKLVVQALDAVAPAATLAGLIEAAEEALLGVNERLLTLSREELDNQTIGSTVVALLAHGGFAAVLWVGDSRAYRLRDGALALLMQEHTQAEELIERGVLEPGSAELHPAFNVLTRAVGAQTPLFVDLDVFEVAAGDTFLLCSDGLTKGLSDEEIVQSLDPGDLDVSAARLVARAIEQGSNDNVTTLLIRAE